MYITIFGICFVIFVVTYAIMGKILIELGLKQSVFYNFDTWKLFTKIMKERESSDYLLLFLANMSSLFILIAIFIVAAYYY